MHRKGLNCYSISQKALAYGGLRPPDPLKLSCSFRSAELNNFKTSNIQYRFFHECGQLNMVSNNACCYLFQIFVSNMCMVPSSIFLNFLGKGSPSLLRPSQTLPRFISASSSVQTSPSFIVPSIRAPPSKND